MTASAPAFVAVRSPRCRCGAVASAACCPAARAATAAADTVATRWGRWVREGPLLDVLVAGGRHRVPIVAALDASDREAAVVGARTVRGVDAQDETQLRAALEEIRAAAAWDKFTARRAAGATSR